MDGSLKAFAIDLESLSVKPVNPGAPGGEYSCFCSFADWERGARTESLPFQKRFRASDSRGSERYFQISK